MATWSQGGSVARNDREARSGDCDLEQRQTDGPKQSRLRLVATYSEAKEACQSDSDGLACTLHAPMHRKPCILSTDVPDCCPMAYEEGFGSIGKPRDRAAYLQQTQQRFW
ncbi:hypothetical protein PHBOTO_006396 [Pseudozyma hubeiensis]|nr:hypothetical protein PHBOTO_006396 [Pseudozyma hubeiensis]